MTTNRYNRVPQSAPNQTGQAQPRRHLKLEQWKAEGQSFPTDGHKTILNRINNESKTNKKRTNIDNKNKTQQNRKILLHTPEKKKKKKTVSQQQKKKKKERKKKNNNKKSKTPLPPPKKTTTKQQNKQNKKITTTAWHCVLIYCKKPQRHSFLTFIFQKAGHVATNFYSWLLSGILMSLI